MKNVCRHCDYEADWPAAATERMFPPVGAVALVNLEGCPGCGNGAGGAFCWRMEDGSERPALAGIDDLEEQNVAIIDTLTRSRRAATN